MFYYGLDTAWCRGDAANSTPFFQFSFPEEDALSVSLAAELFLLVEVHKKWCMDFGKNGYKTPSTDDEVNAG
jgi:hypothetical protein